MDGEHVWIGKKIDKTPTIAVKGGCAGNTSDLIN